MNKTESAILDKIKAGRKAFGTGDGRRVINAINALEKQGMIKTTRKSFHSAIHGTDTTIICEIN